MFSKEILVKTIKQTSKEWLYDPSDFVPYLDINSGSCGEFAEDVFERLILQLPKVLLLFYLQLLLLSLDFYPF